MDPSKAWITDTFEQFFEFAEAILTNTQNVQFSEE